MITSVAVLAYLTRMRELLVEQGFGASMDDMNVIYDAENAGKDEWLSDELADKAMERKEMTTKADVRSKPFFCMFWTRTALEPIVRQRYRLLDTPDPDPDTGKQPSGPGGKSTVSASFRIACAIVSNKGEAIEDLEEAFAAVFQNTYNMPLSLEYIYNSDFVKDKTINFTFIQNMGEPDLVAYKEGNLFGYAWSATIYMNYVSEFAWSRVYPVEKLVVDLYGRKGFPISSLDEVGHSVTRQLVGPDGKPVKGPDGKFVEVPVEPTVALTAAKPHDYVRFAITAPYTGTPAEIMPETRVLIESAIVDAGGEVSIHRTKYMVIANMPLSANPPPEDSLSGSGSGHDAVEPDREAYMMSTLIALSEAIAAATGEEYVITPMPVEG